MRFFSAGVNDTISHNRVIAAWPDGSGYSLGHKGYLSKMILIKKKRMASDASCVELLQSKEISVAAEVQHNAEKDWMAEMELDLQETEKKWPMIKTER